MNWGTNYAFSGRESVLQDLLEHQEGRSHNAGSLIDKAIKSVES
jgi:hypothetical protein